MRTKCGTELLPISDVLVDFPNSCHAAHYQLHCTYLPSTQDELASIRQLSYSGVHVVLLCFSVVQPASFHALRSAWLRELAGAGFVLNPSAERLIATLSAKHDSSLPVEPNGLSAAAAAHNERGSTRSSSRWKDRPAGSVTASAVATSRHGGKTVSKTASSNQIPGPVFLLIGCACDLRNDIGRHLELLQSNEKPVDQGMAEQLASEYGAEAYVECSAVTEKNLKSVFDLAIWCGLRVADLGGPAYRFSVNGQCAPNSSSDQSSTQPPTISHRSTDVAGGAADSPKPQSTIISISTEDSLDRRSPRSDKSVWRRLFCIA